MSKRAILGSIAAIVLLALVLLVLPRGEAADATLAFRRYLSNAGLTVREGVSPPDDGTFVLLRDLREPADARDLLDWVRRGGRLVLADPTSPVAALLGVGPVAPLGLMGGQTLTPGCAAAEVVGVERIVARASDWALGSNGSAVSCFPGDRGSYLMLLHEGDGTVVLLGGTSALTNELLRERDNAVLAVRLVGMDSAVVFGPPIPPTAAGSSRGLWASVPTPVRVMTVALCLAAATFALVRGRRLGRPVTEAPLVPIPAIELPRSVGRLYRRAQTPGYAGRLMREATNARLAARYGGRGPDAASVIASASGLTADDVRAALDGPDPSSDDELIALGERLHEIEARVREGAR